MVSLVSAYRMRIGLRVSLLVVTAGAVSALLLLLVFGQATSFHTASFLSLARSLPRPHSPNPIPPLHMLENMTTRDLQAFYHRYMNSPQVTCSGVERMGRLKDGGWEICDDPKWRPDWADCLVYSFGINFDFSFDDEVARLGCEVHSFDPSMHQKSHLRRNRVHFHDTGISGNESRTENSLSMYWELATLGQHRYRLHHTQPERRVDIVKMDVEGWELPSLTLALHEARLDDVRQLLFETHLVLAAGTRDPSTDQYIKYLQMMRQVYDAGFRIFMTHRNYVYSAFESKLSNGKKRALCHEVHTVNVNLVNGLNGLSQPPPAFNLTS